jgi:hypothetical protein
VQENPNARVFVDRLDVGFNVKVIKGVLVIVMGREAHAYSPPPPTPFSRSRDPARRSRPP